MGNKQEELEAIVQRENYDMVAITETWWDDSHNWSAAMDGYKLFRRDGQGRRGGGVALLEKRRLHTDLIAAFQCLKGPYKKAGEGLFTRAWGDRTNGNGFKLKKGRFLLDMNKKFFTMRVVRHWNRLPREVVDAPSLETFKVRLDRVLSNVV
ncbi:hypothetical protein QYF61_015429 [Mycteria americana]|uniref:Endonuclease/exonuclease/phosphatase domain-containing protein n=1 Tax=Mycteria americana TaxID=33587 RepID=A0AAN7Q442_MYCAM|nr:hypothetical protein QYF61_015429 [Mycteria americana]